MPLNKEHPTAEVEAVAWDWLDSKFQNIERGDDPNDLAYDADEMVDAFMAGHAATLSTKESDLRAENERLREALWPFASVAMAFDCSIAPDGHDEGLTVLAHIHCRPEYEVQLSTADFHRARAALQGSAS